MRLKGSVQRNVTWVEIGLKKSVLKAVYQKDLFFKIKGMPSREEHKTSFVVFTIEMNLLVKFTNPENDGLRTFNLKKPWITSYELRDTRYKLRAKICGIKSRLRQLMTVRYGTWTTPTWNYFTVQNHTVHWLNSAVPADLRRLMIVRLKYCTIRSLDGVSKISKFIVRRPSFAGFCVLTQQVQ